MVKFQSVRAFRAVRSGKIYALSARQAVDQDVAKRTHAGAEYRKNDAVNDI